MRNHLGKLGGRALLLLLAVCGMATSCKDEFLLDDEKPSWLGNSIYDELEARKEFSNYLRLLADPDINASDDADNNRGLVDILKKTGSKTVFVANDKAWQQFFADNALLPETNPWHTATSYDKLSPSQKKLLVHTSMLNNAIVMENLASDETTKDRDGNIVYPMRGQYLRRNTDVETTDTIMYLDGESLPFSYEMKKDEKNKPIEGTAVKDYWARFRTKNGGTGVYLVNDSTPSMMIHFTSEYLTNNNITDEDFKVIAGRERITSDVHIYDALLQKKDGVCQNGYINETEKVLRPLPSMAEMLRTNGKTRIFSHMIDRWSVPFYNKHVTEAYKKIMSAQGIEWKDSIFTKRYFADKAWNAGSTGLITDPYGELVYDKKTLLTFDPGWNAYYDKDNAAANSKNDMAAMYVPNDEALWEYFSPTGGGWDLIAVNNNTPETCSDAHTEEDYEKLFRNIDQIPQSQLVSLINLIMFPSFNASVPSKMTKLKETGSGEQIFFPGDEKTIVDAMLASNGVIYVTDKVYGPSDFTSVAAPAHISNDKRIIDWAIYNEGSKVDDGKGLVSFHYYAYLKAMQSRFVFFLPTDNGMQYYYDPISFNSTVARMLKYSFKGDGATYSASIKCEPIRYFPKTGEIGDKYDTDIVTLGEDESYNRLKDVLESHTIVLEDKNMDINNDVDEYYLAKNGSPVRVVREGGKIVKVLGGYQMENAAKTDFDATAIGLKENIVEEERNMNNGKTFVLNTPMIPASRSVYNVFNGAPKAQNGVQTGYNAFLELCTPDGTRKKAVLDNCGILDRIDKDGNRIKASATEKDAGRKNYDIFVSVYGSSAAPTAYAPDRNVSFFNSYHYTIFVPTDEAIDEAIANGLPTWESIFDEYENGLKVNVVKQNDLTKEIKDLKNNGDEIPAEKQEELAALIAQNAADSLVLQAKITYLNNFIRYHFADYSVFVDQSEIRNTDNTVADYGKEFVTSSYDAKKEVFNKLYIYRKNGVLKVHDVQSKCTSANDAGWVTVGDKNNVLARDIVCEGKSPLDQASMNNVLMATSSFAVIHQIPKVLYHATGTPESHWSTTSAARSYLKRYAIH